MTSHRIDEPGRQPAAPAPPPSDAGARALRLLERYAEALTAGDAQAALAVVEEALSDGIPPAEIQAAVIQPALVRVGELWEHHELTVADEHLASEITQRVLVRLVAPLRAAEPSTREKVLVSAVEGERHVIGLRMVADVLEGAGFDVLFLGADVPTGSLIAAIARHAPAVTVLGCTCTATALVEAISAIGDSPVETR